MIDVSIIICTWNNASRLRITLQSLCGCRVPSDLRWEVVVVNNNCTDRTDDVVREAASRLPLTYVHESNQGLSRARNAGLAAAQGDWIVFTDDDVRFDENWLAAYCTAFATSDGMQYFGGPIESEFEGTTPDAELLAAAPPSVRGLCYGQRARALTGKESFVSANWACPADALRAGGGFDVALGLGAEPNRVGVGEETDIQQRLVNRGYRGWYLPNAPLKHWVPRDKCTLRHIADRRQATAELWQVRRLKHTGASLPIRPPKQLRRRAARCLLRWATSKLLGSTGCREYLEYRWVRGRIQGYKRLAKTENSQ